MKDEEKLSYLLQQKSLSLAPGEQYWVALVGAPGSGKSTLSEKLKLTLGDALAIIPMDGFHYYRHELDSMQDPVNAHARRGAPFTFNADKFVETLINAKQQGKGDFPSFDHVHGDPVENDIHLNSGTKIVLVEGNYLLLNESPWSQLKERVFDESWFLYVPLEECHRRLCARHMKTGLNHQEALTRVESNDSINALLVNDVSMKNADRVIRF